MVTDYYRPLVGGSIRSTELLARHLAKAGNEVAIATSWQPELPAREEIDGIDVHRLRDFASRLRFVSEDPYKHNPPPFPDPEGAWRFRRLVKRFQPDLIHTYGWMSHSVALGVLGLGIPMLLTARDYGNVCAIGTLYRHQREVCSGPAPMKCLACAADRYGAVKGAAAVTGIFGAGPLLRRTTTSVHAVGRYVGGIIDRFLRVPGAPVTVIPNFHESDTAPPDADVIEALPDEPFILFVGGFRRIKGIEDLFAAYSELNDPPPLVMAGTRMSDTPASFPEGVVTFEDVSSATVMAMWDRALFGVAPTRIPEPLGNVVHEAMSRGRAMIGTRPGGHEDQIDDGETGLLVPAGDSTALHSAMRRLINDTSLRNSIGEKAQVKAQEFTAAAVVPRLERLYRETAATGTGALA